MSNSSNTGNTGNTNLCPDQTINFLYFMSNYPSDFINQVWTGYLADHLKSKFLSLCEHHKKSNLAFLHWFYELSHHNQTTLLIWVNENYKAFSHLKI